MRVNLARDDEVTTSDADLTERSFRSDEGITKTKPTKDKPMPSVNIMMEIPDKLLCLNEEVAIPLDGFLANGLPLLTTLLHDV